MAVDREAAARTLSELERLQQRTREAVRYGASSIFLIMWGVLTSLGHVFEHMDPAHARQGWNAVMMAGLGGGFIIAYLRARSRAGSSNTADWRLLYALLVLVFYGLLVTRVFGSFDHRQLDAFWPSLFMFGFVLAGFWVGRFFMVCGLAVTLLVAIGYLWAGPWFDLWLAVCEGGALILGGLWLRKVGVPR